MKVNIKTTSTAYWGDQFQQYSIDCDSNAWRHFTDVDEVDMQGGLLRIGTQGPGDICNVDMNDIDYFHVKPEDEENK